MKPEKTYHVGLLKAGKKVMVQMTGTVDELHPQIWQYYGERITTKQRVKDRKAELLIAINSEYNKNFKYISIH